MTNKEEKKQVKANAKKFEKEKKLIKSSLDKTIEKYEKENAQLETIFIGLGAYASLKESELSNSFFYDTVQNILVKYSFPKDEYSQEEVSKLCRVFLQERLNKAREENSVE